MPIRVKEKDPKIGPGGHKSYEFEVVIEKGAQGSQAATKNPKGKT
ncbi:MAG: hypothetical protein ACREIQ_03055 [Nitrospiria bacterium]